MSKDEELTDEEKRILADIERYEDELRTRLPWKRLRTPERPWRDVRGWGAVVIGTAVLVTALVANVGLVPFAGFVILLAGVTRITDRISYAGWRSWLRDVRRNLSPPRSGQDGT